MLGSSTRGLLFMWTFLAVSVMYQVVALSVAELGHSVRMIGWENVAIFGERLVESLCAALML